MSEPLSPIGARVKDFTAEDRAYWEWATATENKATFGGQVVGLLLRRLQQARPNKALAIRFGTGERIVGFETLEEAYRWINKQPDNIHWAVRHVEEPAK